MIKIDKTLFEKIVLLHDNADFALHTDCILKDGKLVRNVVIIPKSPISKKEVHFLEDIPSVFDDELSENKRDDERQIPFIEFSDLKEILSAKNSITKNIWHQLPESEDPVVKSDGTILFPYYDFCAKMSDGNFLNFRIKDVPDYNNFMNLPDTYSNKDLKEIYLNKIYFEGKLYDKHDNAVQEALFFNEIDFIELADYYLCSLELKNLKKIMTCNN